MSRKSDVVELDIEKLPALPNGWHWGRMEDAATKERNAIVDGPFGSNLKLSDYIEPPGVPVLTTANLRGDYSAGSVRYISQSKFQELKRSEVRAGDILVAKIGSCGLTGIYPEGMPSAIIPANLLKMTVNPDFLQKFVFYYLHSPIFSTFLKEIITATAQPAFNVSKFRQLPFPLTSLDEQRRIVAEIEKQFTRLDAGVSALQRVRSKLKQYRAAVLKAACEGRLVPTEAELARAQNRDTESAKVLLERILQERRAKWNGRGKYSEPAPPSTPDLPPLPEGWVWASLGQLAWSVKDGPHYSPKYVQEGIPFISGGNVRPTGIDFDSAKRISPELHEELSKRCKPEFGDLLYTKGGTTGIARVNTYHEEFNVWVHVAVLKLVDSIHRFYVQHALNSPFCYEQSQKFTHGVGNQDLGLTRMINIVFGLPPLVEQERIVAEVERRLSVVDELEATVTANLQRAARLRQAILTKMFSEEKSILEKEI